MNHTEITAGEIIRRFSSTAAANESVITLGGTGPNGSCQIAVLELIGFDIVQQKKAINILSGSAFGYFIYLAFHQEMMRIENYIDYDSGVRKLHRASCLKALWHFCSGKYKRESLYDNSRVKDTVFHLFQPAYANRALRSFNGNMIFWSYCSIRKDLIRIDADTFPHMKVWEVITACLSIKAVHGEFRYGDYQLSDPMFCPLFRKLVKTLVRGGENHLFLNYKKTQTSRNLMFLKNQPIKTPVLCLLFDFVSFIFNFRNPRLIETHRSNAVQLTRGEATLSPVGCE